MLRASFAVLAILLAIALRPIAATAATPEEVRASLEGAREQQIQWVLPGGPEPTRRRGPGLDLPILEILLYSLAAAAVIALAFFVASFVRGRRFAPPDEAAEARDAPAVQLSTLPRELAELAAREGDFAEAIHLLLLGTIEEIRASLGYDAHPSLTSREIVRRAPLPPGAGPPLAGIVAEVERSRFGARPVAEADFRRTLEYHDELRRACGSGPRPHAAGSAPR